MAFNNGFTAVTGATYTAAQYNTYVRDNFNALWVYTTAGDLVYANSATTLTRLGIATAYKVLYSTGSAPAWLFIQTILQNAAIIPSQAVGDLLYAASATALARLAAPADNGYYLGHTGSAPVWVANYRYMAFQLNTDIALNAGEDILRFRIPAALNGWNIVSVAASRKSGTGVPSFGLRNVTDGVEVLSTNVTIDSGETDSSTAAIPAVIDVAHDDVATADQFAIDVDAAGTSTLYAFVEIGFLKP